MRIRPYTIRSPLRPQRMAGMLLCFLALVAIDVKAETGSDRPANRLALVIGISNYANWPALTDAAAEARQMAGLLEQGGFVTTLVTDPDAEALKAAWSRFVQRAGAQPDGTSLVYYRGQSKTIVTPDGLRNGVLIPTDAPPSGAPQADPDEKGLWLKDLIEDAGALGEGDLIFLFDTGFTDDRLERIKPVLRLSGLAAGRPARQAILAADGLGRAPSAPSHFTAALLKALTGEADIIRDGHVSGVELAVYLENRLTATTSGRRRPRYALFGDRATYGGDVAIEAIHPTRRTARLYVDTQPASSRIRILNIKPKFSQGMVLDPGRYHLEVSAAGHRQFRGWVELKTAEDKTLQIRLQEIETQFTNALGMIFRYIPPGRFQMGGAEGSTGSGRTGKRHRVTLTRPFYMLISEVTIGQFRRFAEASGHYRQDRKTPGCWTSSDGRRWHKASRINWETIAGTWPEVGHAPDDLPVSCVTWEEANAFAAWLSRTDRRTYRLPTEAQWEYACRAGTTTAFAYGDCLSMELANFNDTGLRPSACPAGKRPARLHLVAANSLSTNEWGLYHMHGNVAEWCYDYYDPYPDRAVKDPRGPATGVEKVIRGGHFLSRMTDCRSAKRSSFPPEYASSAVGFRLIALAQ